MAQLDLNLLRVLDALVATSSVTEAASRLALSPPAASRALGRLRVSMGDEILVRAGRGMVPTPFALRVAASVRALLDEADGLTRTGEDDPSTWNRAFTIRMNESLIPVLAPALTERVVAEAPGVLLRFVPQESKDAEALRDGTLDLDVGIRVASPPDVLAAPLVTDRFVAVVGARTALGRKATLTLDDLVAHPHVSASRRGRARGPVDEALEATGRTRRVVAVAPTYAVAALMVVGSGSVCLLPELMTERLIDGGVPLRAHRLPFDLPEVQVDQRWHRRADADPASRWLRRALDAVAVDVAAARRRR
ncbi:LysR family transcriptional regulator [Clavibacter michiganensis]|nr:LysR family transcriptional regulator [Clavibacter michiganensis]